MNPFARESFLPVVLVLVAIFLVLLAVNFRANQESARGIMVDIESFPIDATSGGNDEDEEQAAGSLGPRLSKNETSDPTVAEVQKLVTEGKFKEALEKYQLVFSRGLTSQSLNDLGLLYLMQDDLEKARFYLTVALETEPVYSISYFNRGFVLSRMELYEEAVKDYEVAVIRNPYHFEALYNMGLAQLKLGRWEGALGTFTRAVPLSSRARKARTLYNAGVASSKLGQRREAKKLFEQAISNKPDYLKPRYGLADLEPHTKAGLINARKQYETIFRLKPNYPPAYFNLGLLYSTRGDLKEAEKTYRKAIQIFPEYYKAHYNLGILLLKQKKWSKARSEFLWCLEREPEAASCFFNLGRVAFGQRKHEEALSQYKQAIVLKQGNYPEAYFNMGLVYSAQDLDGKAIQAYKSALKRRKNWPEANFNLGLAYMRRNQKRSAQRALEKAVKQNPGYSRAWFNLGVVFSRRKIDDQAIEAFKKALEIKPTYIQARLNLGVRYSIQGRYKEAIREYRRVLDTDEKYALAWINLGLAYLKIDQNEGAESAFRKALELEPSKMKIRKYLAQALAKQVK